MGEFTAPGLRWRARADGKSVPYWIARADLIRKGYAPKAVRLIYDAEDPASRGLIIQRCHVLQAEMLEWSASSGTRRHSFDGTLRSLWKRYESDPDSPYHDLKVTTQRSYSKHLRLLMDRIGDRRADAVTGADVRRWYKNLAAPSEEGGSARTAYAYLMVSIFKCLVSYGASLGAELASPNPCIGLREQLRATKFSQAPARRTRLTYDQVVMFREAAYAAGRPSMALGVTLQFECAFRQIDVIGEWEGERWKSGVQWANIGKDGVLRKTTTKTGADAEHRLSDHPDLVAELERIPPERRIGPLVIEERSGKPYKAEIYRYWFRKLARQCGIPDHVWNMDARAGAVTEAYEAGASTEDAMALATHTQVSTSRRYRRASVEQTGRAAALRNKSRDADR